MLKMLYPEERMVKEEWIMARAKDAIINEYTDFSNISWGDDEVEEKCKVDCIQYLDNVADFDKPDPAYEALCNFLGV